MTPNNDTPSIRFAGFTDAWEQRKLGELGSLKNGMNFSKDAMGVGYPFVNLQNIFGRNVIDCMDLGKAMASPAQLKDYSLQEGDVLFVRSSVKLEGVGEAALVPNNLENTTYSGFIIRFRDEYGLANDYKRFAFSTDCVRDQIMAQATDSANKNISQSVLSNLTIFVPQREEQEQIGSFFSRLDTLITLHQRKYDQLVNIKKSMLEKMFPKNGELVPEVRFAGFTDAWEQRKLGELCDVFRSGEFIKASDIYVDGAFPVYGGNGLRGHADRFNYDGNYALIGRQGALCGNMNFSSGKAYFTEHAVAVHANDNNNTRFLFYLLDTMNLGQYSAQSAQPGLAVNKLITLPALCPSKLEQETIAEFLTRIDDLITLHQRKLERLQNIKKACLEKMFV